MKADEAGAACDQNSFCHFSTFDAIIESIMSERPVVAAFDFDGTLTFGDTLFSFLRFSCGFWTTLWKLFFKLPLLLGYVFGHSSRQSTKEKVLASFFKGMKKEKFEEMGKAFADRVLDRHLRAKGLERVLWHKAQGHRLILISASIDVYLEPWAKRHGFDEALSSRMEYKEGKVTGRLEGKNCWGEEKVSRLEALLGDKSGYSLFAYGNSRGDKELLALADHPFYCEFH